MRSLTLDLSAMYGDHHVVEVRRILLEMPGVEDVYASSAFRVVEVSYDPGKVKPDAIQAVLGEAGYLDDLDVPLETGAPATAQDGGDASFRHTAAFEQTGQVISFGRNTPYSGRPLWPCPGMGTVEMSEEE